MMFIPAEHQLYKITSGLSPKMVLDCSQNPQTMNKVILYTWNDGPNQKFAIRALGANKFALFCSANNGTVEVAGGNPSNGAEIIVSEPNKQSNEFWEFVPVEDKKFAGQHAYHLRSFSGKCMDVCEGAKKNDTPIIQYDYNGGPNQVWIIEHCT